MKAKSTVLTLILCFLGAGVCFAQSPFMGSWQLNEAKSKIGPGAMKATTVVYKAAGDSIKLTVDGTDAAGNPMHYEWTGKFDGKAYQVTGSPTADSESYRRISNHVLTFTLWKAGKVTLTGRNEVAMNGKSRTVTTSAIDSNGKRVRSVYVYDKE